MNLTMLGTGHALVTECYNTCFVVNDGGLQPFDVILCEPDETMERFLGIYPE